MKFKFSDLSKYWVDIALFFFVNVALGLMWVGAEYVFEGAVHTSYIDAVFNGVLAFFITKDILK